MAEGRTGGQYLGTASAPVSRQASAEARFEAHHPAHNPSPPSSEGTAVSNEGQGTVGEGVRFADVPRGHSDAGRTGGPGDMFLPPRQNEDQLRRALGSASAPASPDGSDGQQPPLSALKKSETLPERHGNRQHPSLFASDHEDPAVAAGLLPGSEAESQHYGSGSRSAPISRRSSRPHTPSSRHGFHTATLPHAFTFGQGQHSLRGSHQAAHSKPLYSLARPLPTREQRDAQKAYRDSIKEHMGKGSRRTTPSQSRNASQINIVGPGAHHAYNPFGVAPYMAAAPSGHGYVEPDHKGHYPNASSNDEIMRMLQQILQQSQGGKAAAGTLPKEVDQQTDVRDDDQDVALARKEGFGENQAKKDELQDKTRRAERRGSLSSSDSETQLGDGEDEFPNPWARFRHAMREPFAEFLGTMLLIMFGTGVSLQYFLSLDPNVVSSPRGTYLSVSFGWGIGVAVGVWVAGGISGGHINPAVTLSLACFRGFPWKKVPGYVLAQILGSTAGAGLNYAMYRRAISIFEGGGNIRTVSGPTATAALFSTYPLEYVTDATAFFQEFLNTAILLITVLAISDSNNAAPPDGLNPLVLLFLIVGIGACFGMQTAYCINPARDIGPRLVTWWAGYGREVWNFRSQYWLWVPWCATLSGGLMGCIIYDSLIYTGSESPLNRRWDWPWRKKSRSGFGPASKQKMPLGQTEP